MSTGEPHDHSIDLAFHPLAPTLDGPDGLAAEGPAPLVGFAGAAYDGSRFRVYVDLSFTSHFEVARADVVRTVPVDTQETDGPTVVWVKATAQVVFRQISQVSGSASFLTGAIRSRYERSSGPWRTSADLIYKPSPTSLGTACTPLPPPFPGPPPPATPIFYCRSELVSCDPFR